MTQEIGLGSSSSLVCQPESRTCSRSQPGFGPGGVAWCGAATSWAKVSIALHLLQALSGPNPRVIPRRSPDVGHSANEKRSQRWLKEVTDLCRLFFLFSQLLLTHWSQTPAVYSPETALEASAGFHFLVVKLSSPFPALILFDFSAALDTADHLPWLARHLLCCLSFCLPSCSFSVSVPPFS